MDTEHSSHSPNNDSGISPGHGSSGSSSVGRPSPGSPEHFNIQENQGMKSEPNTEQNTSSKEFTNHQQHPGQKVSPVWGIDFLQHPPGQCIVLPAAALCQSTAERSVLDNSSLANMSEPDHPYQQETKSPSSRLHIAQNNTPRTSPLHNLNSLNSVVTPIGNRIHSVSQNVVSPSHCTQSPVFDSPAKLSSHNNIKTPPIPDTNAPPGLNSSLSDDNSRSSSSSSSTLMSVGGNEYFKMTSPEGEQNPLKCLEMAVEQSPIMGRTRGDGGAGAGNNGVRNIYQCPLCDYTTLSR